MNIKSAWRMGESSILALEVGGGIDEFLQNFKAGEYTITRRKNKRSLDANAYAWVLIDKIAGKLHKSKAEVYREAIKDIGGVSEAVCVQDKAVDRLCQTWEAQGLGWQTEKAVSKIDGCTTVFLYYGSSTYDTRQMSVLIDHLAQDAKALGIETMTPEEIARLEGL